MRKLAKWICVCFRIWGWILMEEVLRQSYSHYNQTLSLEAMAVLRQTQAHFSPAV